MSKFTENTTEMKTTTTTILNRQLDYTQWTVEANQRKEEKKIAKHLIELFFFLTTIAPIKRPLKMKKKLENCANHFN